MFLWAAWATQGYAGSNVNATAFYQFSGTWLGQNVVNPTPNLFNNPVSPYNYPFPKPSYQTPQSCYSKPQRYHSTSSSYSSVNAEDDTIMDATKYYSLSRFNDWSVHFPNRIGIPTDKVEEIFSKFGDVKKVSQTGDAYGLCFINFKTEDEAKRAVEGMKNHETIKLRATNHLRKSQQPRESNGGQSNKSNHYSNENQEKSSGSWGEWGKFNDSNRNNNCDDMTKEPEKDNVAVQEPKPLKTSESPAEVLTEPRQEKINGIEKVQHVAADLETNEELKPQRGERPDTLSCQGEDEQDSVPMEMPDLVSMGNLPVAVNGTPAVGSKLASPAISKPMEVIEAQEVIVANIPEDFSVPFILHLLEKYQPISASAMKLVPSYSLRYCHVYFKTVKQAEIVEANFDNVKLDDNNLIVLRANTLASLAALPA